MKRLISKNKKYLRDYWDFSLSVLPDAFFYAQGNDSNLAIWGSRRGGTSIFSELIGTSGHIREIDQPFDSFRTDSLSFRCRKRLLLDKAMCQYFDLSEDEWESILAYLSSLTRGGHRNAYPMALSFSRNTQTVFKILNAPFLADQITEALNLSSIHLTRHPISQALSVMRNQWGLTYEPYVSSRWIRERFLNAPQVQKVDAIHHSGSMLEKYVLNWVFENLYLLRDSKRMQLRVAYEHLVVRPEEVASQLDESLGLHVDVSVLARPSRSRERSTNSKNRAILGADKSALISSWMSEVSTAEIKCVQDILDVFEIETYIAHDPMPIL
jgi:hypothetical protein